MSENENAVYQEHDKLFKAFFQVKETFIDYLVNFFPTELMAYFDFNDFYLDNTTYIKSNMDAFFSDVVYQGKLKANGKTFLIAFLLEHKSYPSKYIAIQLLTYIISIWQNDIANDRELTFILPIIIYQGEKSWQPKSLADHFANIPNEFLRFLPVFDFHLTKVNNYDTEILEKTKGIGLLKSLFLSYKTLGDKDYLEEHIEELFKSFEGKPELLELLRMFVGYVLRNSELSGIELKKRLAKIKSKPLKSDIMSTYDSIIKLGETKGEKRGEKRGEKIGETKKTIAGIVKSLNLGKLTIAEIAETFEVDIDYVLKIKKENNL